MQQINLNNMFVRNELLSFIGGDFVGIFIGIKPN